MEELPFWESVLAVVAHPDDESFGLGGLLGAFADAGARTHVLCFTRGEASTLGAGNLADTRAAEIEAAGRILGVSGITLHRHADGKLDGHSVEQLADLVQLAGRGAQPDGLLVFGPGGVTGHPDHIRATDAAMHAAVSLDLPVLGWVIPATVAETLNTVFHAGFVGVDHPDLRLRVDRRRQRTACEAHESQVNPVLWRRLELLGDTEWAMWLRPPHPTR